MPLARVRQGDIYWLDHCRPLHGDIAKRTPVVVLTANDLIEASPRTLVVACTSAVLPSDSTSIELPNRQKTPQAKSGLNRPTWAVPAWLPPVQPELLTNYVGFIAGATLRKLLEAVQAQLDKPK